MVTEVNTSNQPDGDTRPQPYIQQSSLGMAVPMEGFADHQEILTQGSESWLGNGGKIFGKGLLALHLVLLVILHSLCRFNTCSLFSINYSTYFRIYLSK